MQREYCHEVCCDTRHAGGCCAYLGLLPQGHSGGTQSQPGVRLVVKCSERLKSVKFCARGDPLGEQDKESEIKLNLISAKRGCDSTGVTHNSYSLSNGCDNGGKPVRGEGIEGEDQKVFVVIRPHDQ